jgi:hypothetical protein
LKNLLIGGLSILHLIIIIIGAWRRRKSNGIITIIGIGGGTIGNRIGDAAAKITCGKSTVLVAWRRREIGGRRGTEGIQDGFG